MSIFVNGENVIDLNKLTETTNIGDYSKGIRNTSSKVITGGGTDDVLSVYTDRINSTPENYLDIGSSLVPLPIYIGTTQSARTQLKIIKKGETVGLVPRYIITSSSPGTYMSNYLSTNHKADVRKAIYVIQAPGGGGAGGGDWGILDSGKDAGGAGGGSGGFAVYMTNDISQDYLYNTGTTMGGGAGGAYKSSGSDGDNIVIGSGTTYQTLSVSGGGGGNFRDNINGAAIGGSGGLVSNNIPTARGKLIASYNGRKGGDSNTVGALSVYTSSSIDGQINPNEYFGMKYGSTQNTKAIARFYQEYSSGNFEH